MVRQADDPFVCFSAKSNKGLRIEKSPKPEVGEGTRVEELEEGTQRKELAKGDAEGQLVVDTGQQKRPVGMRERESTISEDQSRWVSIPRGFVEISRRMHVSVSLQMHKGMQSVTT